VSANGSTLDVVVVSYNNRGELRGCVEPLIGLPGVSVVVVDNASSDGSLEVISDLPVTALASGSNSGFAHGCNFGWRAGHGDYVLFLNPDARIDGESLRALAAALDADPALGAVAPRIHDEDGELDYSQRREPRLRTTYAQALFLHRLFPHASWTDEVIRDPRAYEEPGRPDWVSGACILVRRSVLEQLGGLDQGFFMYCEDIDLCRRIRAAGHGLRYEPSALVIHGGGASAPRPALLPVLAASRLRYAAKHRSRFGALLERLGVGLGAATHVLVSRGGRPMRLGHARALRLAASCRTQN
jgi:N-acetylglucosaminyl-diphospho-decaprenol L-rhamnosyltransferase